MTSRLPLLKELRDRVAKATGPSFALDIQIEVMVTPGAIHEWVGDCKIRVGDRRYNPPNYTASLDAAVTLVTGDDWYWRVGHDGEGADPSRFKAEFLPFPHRKVEATADTPELALCLARLNYEIATAEATGKAEG